MMINHDHPRTCCSWAWLKPLEHITCGNSGSLTSEIRIQKPVSSLDFVACQGGISQFMDCDVMPTILRSEGCNTVYPWIIVNQPLFLNDLYKHIHPHLFIVKIVVKHG